MDVFVATKPTPVVMDWNRPVVFLVSARRPATHFSGIHPRPVPSHWTNPFLLPAGMVPVAVVLKPK
jgi:hypothetical protein